MPLTVPSEFAFSTHQRAQRSVSSEASKGTFKRDLRSCFSFYCVISGNAALKSAPRGLPLQTAAKDVRRYFEIFLSFVKLRVSAVATETHPSRAF